MGWRQLQLPRLNCTAQVASRSALGKARLLPDGKVGSPLSTQQLLKHLQLVQPVERTTPLSPHQTGTQTHSTRASLTLVHQQLLQNLQLAQPVGCVPVPLHKVQRRPPQAAGVPHALPLPAGLAGAAQLVGIREVLSPAGRRCSTRPAAPCRTRETRRQQGQQEELPCKPLCLKHPIVTEPTTHPTDCSAHPPTACARCFA